MDVDRPTHYDSGQPVIYLDEWPMGVCPICQERDAAGRVSALLVAGVTRSTSVGTSLGTSLGHGSIGWHQGGSDSLRTRQFESAVTSSRSSGVTQSDLVGYLVAAPMRPNVGWRTGKSARRIKAMQAAWDAASEYIRSLYYCQRDDVLFGASPKWPDTLTWGPPAEVKRFVYNYFGYLELERAGIPPPS